MKPRAKRVLLLNASDVARSEELPFARAEAASVQLRSDLAESLRVQQLVDLSDYFCIGHPPLPRAQWIGQSNCSCSTATKAHMYCDLFAAEHRDVLHE